MHSTKKEPGGRPANRVSGGTGSGKTTLLNALIELIPTDERIVAIEDTIELRIDSPNCVRFEARGLQTGAVTIRDLVKHALRHRPDHIVVGEARVHGLGCRAVQFGQHPADVAVIIAVDFSDARGSRRSGFVACQPSHWRATGCLHAEVFPDPTAAKIATPV